MKNNLKKSELLISPELGIYSNLYKDIYFDKYHGIKETQHNLIKANNFSDSLKKTTVFVEKINSKNELETIFIRDESKIPNLSTREITVTEVRMSQDLKTAKIFVMPLGGKNSDEIIEKLKISSFMIRKVLSKKIIMKFLPKLFFVKDDSFDYAEKIENLIKQTNK